MKINYDNSVEKLTKKHEEDIIKIKNESQKNQNLSDELKIICNEDYKFDLAYLTHCYSLKHEPKDKKLTINHVLQAKATIIKYLIKI